MRMCHLMKKDLKETTFIPDKTFPINVFTTNDIPLHWHSHMEWIIIKEGKARIQVDDVFVHLHKGEIAIINSKQLHAAEVLEANTEIIAIVFNEAIVRNSGLDNTENLYFSPYLNNQVKLPNFIKADNFTKEISNSIFSLIDEYSRKEIGFELFIKAELFRVFGLIYRYFYQMEGTIYQQYQKNYKINHLLEFLRENYSLETSVNEAAKMVNLSPNHFCKVFKTVTSKTLIEYIHLLRINEAERMLNETDLPISEIAEKVGFSSNTYFGRVYKRLKNEPPSERRKKTMNRNILN